MDTTLRRLLAEVGWIDVWRLRNPNTRQFSCFSKMHGLALAYGPFCLGTIRIPNYTCDIEYFPHGVSDHSVIPLP